MRVDNLFLLVLAAEGLYIVMAVLRAVVLRHEGMPDEAIAFWQKTGRAALLASITLVLFGLWRWLM